MSVQRIVTLAAVVGACAAMTACGDDKQAAAPAAAGASSAGVERAQEMVTEFEGLRPEFLELPKLDKTPPPEGLDVTILTCPLPACQETTSGAVEAAKTLGWNVNYVTSKLAPEDYVARFNDIVADPPDALAFLSAFPNETVAAQLKKITDADIPIMQIAPQAGEAPGDFGIPGIIQGPPLFELGGALAANKVIADAGGATTAAIVHDPAFGVFQASLDGWTDTFGENCPDCSLETIEVSLNAPAGQNTSKIIQFLQRNPDVKYLFFVIGDAAVGMPDALASASLTDKVKFITQTPTIADLDQIDKGTQWATIQVENKTGGYRAIDGLLRQLAGMDIGPERYPTGYHRILTQENVEPGALPQVPGTPDTFFDAWRAQG